MLIFSAAITPLRRHYYAIDAIAISVTPLLPLLLFY
jgi:hypothetical protein